jgi:REP element-mobilizing transposase RayT
MPRRGFCWWHVIWSTHCSWLPGDPRGFRNRRHRIHSSGDYRRPPPVGEHAGLHQYHQSRSADAVELTPVQQVLARDFIVVACGRLGIRLLASSIGRQHVHLLAELPTDWRRTKRVVGHLKTKSSRFVKVGSRNRLWSTGGKFLPVEDRAYQMTVFRYITERQERNAVIWSLRDPKPGFVLSDEDLSPKIRNVVAALMGGEDEGGSTKSGGSP